MRVSQCCRQSSLTTRNTTYPAAVIARANEKTHVRRICSMAFPLANSSMSLSR